MKKITKILSTAVLTTALGISSAQAGVNNITIGTNPSGSTFYLLGGGFSKLFQEKLRIRSSAQPFAGSSAYLPMINSGELTLGIANTVDTDMAYNGRDEFPEKMQNLRTLANIWVIPYAYITRADSGILTADDLAGKRVMGDIPAAVALTRINEAILKSGGLELKDVDFMRSGGLMDGISAVVEGRADAAPVATTMPVLVESNSSVPNGLRIVGNGSKAQDPDFYPNTLPGIRNGVAKEDAKRPFVIGDTHVVNYNTLLVGSKSLSNDDAYKLTKALYDNWEKLQRDYGPLRGVAQSDLALATPTAPYHDGAVKFFKEVGLWTAEHQAHQDRLSNN